MSAHEDTAPAWARAVLVHGFTGSPWELGELPEAFARAGVAPEVLTLPGHATSVEELAGTCWEDWCEAVDAGVERARTHGLPVFLLGMSLGGLLVLRAAARVQSAAPLAGVLTLGIPLQLDLPTRVVLRACLFAGNSLPNWRLRKSDGADILEPEAHRSSPNYGYNPLRAARWLEHGATVVRALLPSFRAPLLAVHGAQDHVADPRGSEELVRSVRSSDVTLLRLPRSAHGVARDYERFQLYSAVERWLLAHRP